MRYALLITGLLFFWVVRICAQEQFSMFLVFTDSLGHQDSILVGYDSNRPSNDGDHLNFNYDGLSNDEPFDSVLEVRGGYNLYYMLEDGEMSDSLIAHFDGDCKPLGVMATMLLLVHSKYPPVTITWDSVALNESYCRSYSFFRNNEAALTLPDEGGDPFVINDVSTFTPPFSNWQFNGNMPIPQTYLPIKVEGLGQVEVPLLIFDMKTDFWTGTEINNLTNDIQIWPNPGDGQIYLDLMQSGTARIFGIDGSLIFEQTIQDESPKSKVDIRFLGNGLYWVTFWKNGKLIWREGYIKTQ